VIEVAEAALSRGGYVAPVEVLSWVGWVSGNQMDAWRQGRVETFEELMQTGVPRRAEALRVLEEWAKERGLRPSETAYVTTTRDRRPLRFTRDGDEATERFYRTHWLSPELSEKRLERLVEKQSKPPDLVVILPLNEWTCALCGGTGGFLTMESAGPICLTCAELDHLVFLPSGDATLSRRAKKASGLAAVVVRFSRSRNRYERQGILVEEAALEQAEEACLADDDVRARRRERDADRRGFEDVAFHSRMAGEIARLFPSIPPERAEAIARHTGTRGSGRVGRSAAGRALDEHAITRAVVASVRHQDTPYDELLMAGVPRLEARDRVRDAVDQVLDRWHRPRLYVVDGSS